MTNLKSKLKVIFSETAAANRASVGIWYEHITGYDLSTGFLNGVLESYYTLLIAEKDK